MISATLLALLATAAPAQAPSASVFLKAPAAAAPACKVTRVDDRLVRAPLFSTESAQCPVASVGEEVIVLGELAEVLEAGHVRPRTTGAPAKKPDMDFTPALDRLIATRLVIQEARDMRLDDAPAVRRAIDDFKAAGMRSLLQKDALKNVKPDAAEVERLYRGAVREFKVKSVLLDKEDAAKAFEAGLKGGQGFDALVKRFVAEKKAKGGEKAEFVPPKHMLPEVREALSQAKPGVPTGLVKVPTGWVVLRIDGTRYPKHDKEARAQARAQSLARKEREAVRAFYLSLVKKYATVDEPLLKAIDFEGNGEKGFEALMKDPRPLVTIRGDQPITVADLAREVSMKFFHGLENPIKEKRVNPTKAESFERVLGARLFAKEAKARKLDQRPEYRGRVGDYERELAFNTFVEKVIMPDVKVTEEEVTKYYEAHKAEYTTPQMFKLDGIAFATPREAQAALEKLKAGTDFNWLRTSAPEQLPAEQRTLLFDANTVSAATLPVPLREALTGTSTGAHRLYAAREGEIYVIRVVDQKAAAPQPYVEAREPIAKVLFNQKIEQSLREYTGKLRKTQKVDVLITRVSM